MIVAGGGTGGHLFPGLAVAEATHSGDAVLFVGSSAGIEARVIPRTRFPFVALPIRGVRGRGWRGLADLVSLLPGALLRAWRTVGEFGAQVVVGVGGYASFPIVAAAWLRGVPSVLLEQNAKPGMANRVLGHLARRVCTTFDQAASFFPRGKVLLTGNPVRAFAAARTAAPAAAPHGGFTLLVFGGSQGARSINRAVLDAAADLQASIAGLRIIHQTGVGQADEARRRYAAAGIEADVYEFIDDMGSAYAAADLVVCRSGATTIAELTALGKPAIFVPYPLAADDHQRANAEVVAAAGAGVVILDRELNGARLGAAVVEVAGDAPRRAAMGEAARRLARPDAARRVVELCRELVGEVGG